MEDISGKFREWLLEKDKWGLYKRRAEMCPDTLEVGFCHGYTIAQKEMQNALENKDREMVQVKHLYKHLEEKLDAAIEVIKRIVDSQYRSDVSHFDVMNEAQDFLKARGE